MDVKNDKIWIVIFNKLTVKATILGIVKQKKGQEHRLCVLMITASKIMR